MSGPAIGSRLLGLLEPGWRRHLVAGEPAGALDVAPEVLTAAATALGDLSRSQPPRVLARRWPACVVVAVAHVTAHHAKDARVWPAWHRAAGVRAGKRSTADWAEAFLASLATLGLPAVRGDPQQAVLAHAAVSPPSPPGVLLVAGAGAAGTPPCRLEPFGRGVLTRDAETSSGPGPAASHSPGPAASHNPGSAASHEPGSLPGDGLADAGSWTAMSPGEVSDWPDPLLAFDAEGDSIATELPPEAVWLVYPADRALRSDAMLPILVESRLPLAWNGWRLVQVDLSEAAWLELVPAGAPWRRPVRGRAKPRLVPGTPVPGITTADGLSVAGSLPAVRLPAGDVRWRVEVRRLRSGKALAAAEVGGDPRDAERLWDQAPRPVLGVLVVTATALGDAPVPGLRRVLAVAEGLTVSYSPALRLPGTDGLETAETVLYAPAGMTVAPCAAVIPAGTAGVDVTCVADQVMLPVRVTPPHWRVRIEPQPGSDGTPTAWHSLGPLRLEVPGLVRGGVLRLDLPGVTGDPPVDVVAAGAVVQVLEPFRRGGYPLRRMLDTVIAHGGAQLRITVGSRTAVIARVSSPAAATDPWSPG